ncbi:hypothetical protein PG5_50700 [Pseudomonas sp. G5(2012)]|nr:hypothetical protein PG5_50700 [Pseudomonas sp. G5(2012)]
MATKHLLCGLKLCTECSVLLLQRIEPLTVLPTLFGFSVPERWLQSLTCRQ